MPQLLHYATPPPPRSGTWVRWVMCAALLGVAVPLFWVGLIWAMSKLFGVG